ncbi:hypothetical protein FNU76_18615 [Chitinimonas arctica]|uniref:Uncharacterized protein n=1 Tax=Chitinimonas arctica TaxID=2594795 RepID=A0A516SJ79_9NEIS|nr:hypothetical protein [Chitinimonas arctica]QDQ28197.1 hypothetical protein FNU76_18615 [Chitinimonas arctica]
MEPTRKLKVSIRLFGLNVLGAVMAAVGLVGVQGQGAVLHPVLAMPALGWGLLLAGFGLMAWFMVDVFKRIRAQQSARHQQETCQLE